MAGTPGLLDLYTRRARAPCPAALDLPTPSTSREMADTDFSGDIAALERFLIGNLDLERLETLLGQFNLFEAVGVTRQELRHSDFLGFLLDPRAAHGLGDRFLTLFLRKRCEP